ncbi:hypothetical protein MPH_07125 [Macrophomina phaseolina MS6]|uniref:Uncharacterized protein n=1 Tax=Macrophomina phaseolina (strain MS6) TaxID=1126212 RepID=K2SFU9_MACPH|nr:hypothetical protein MPH_07125 [Macrophomina phaseolina MS6]
MVWEPESFARSIEPDSVITGFAQGYDGLNSKSSDVEVLATEWEGNDVSWLDSQDNETLASFSSEANFSSIIATAAGKFTLWMGTSSLNGSGRISLGLFGRQGA